MSPIVIRKATQNDAEALTNCIDAAYASFKNQISDLPDVSADLMSVIETKLVWVAIKDDEIVGGMVLDSVGDHLILQNIAVHPNASGAGVGKKLIQKAESECQRLSLAEIRLSTHSAMTKNVSLYEHLGWSIVKVEGNKVHMTKGL